MDCGPSPVIVSFCLLVHHTLSECELLRLSFFVLFFVLFVCCCFACDLLMYVLPSIILECLFK